MKKMLAFGCLAALSVGSSAPAAAQAARSNQVTRPNVLWLIAEDFGPHLGCYGAKSVRTPILDNLAAQGVRYTRAYTTAPVCSPSRSAFMTGMYQHSIGAQEHRTPNKKPLPDGVRVLPDWLREAGYFSANVVQMPAGFGFKGSGKTDWNFKREGKAFDSNNWDDLKAHQPFYAQVNFQETHRRFHAPAQADHNEVEIAPYYPDHPVTRQDRAQYLDAASELDRKVGLVLQQLEKDGLADNTVILFFGDNGEANVRGKQFCYEEGLHVPMIMRWPKNFPAPTQIAPGKVDERFIEAIDFAPTMLDIVGLKKPEKMQGRIFLGERAEAPRQYAYGARDRCDETVMRLRTVRDARYRYIRNFTPQVPFLAPNNYKETQYPVWNLLKELYAQDKLTPAQAFLCQPRQPEEELYDLQNDPWEIHNLAAHPQSAATLQHLRGLLQKSLKETNDPLGSKMGMAN